MSEQDPIVRAVSLKRATTLNEVTEKMAAVFGVDMTAMSTYERSVLMCKTYVALKDFHVDKFDLVAP